MVAAVPRTAYIVAPIIHTTKGHCLIIFIIDKRTPDGDWKCVDIRRLICVSLCLCYICKLLV